MERNKREKPAVLIQVFTQYPVIPMNLDQQSQRQPLREWLYWWVREVHNVSWIFGKALFVELASIERIDKQAHGRAKCFGTTRETSG